MPPLHTDAIVLHVADYLESSRLLRLLTREAGVQSVVARGARSSRQRFGSATDLFAEGAAQLTVKPGRDLHALDRFDVLRARPTIAGRLDRFMAASALAEVVLRLVHDEASAEVFGVVAESLDRLGAAEEGVASVALGGIWRLLAEVGFRPALDHCVECHQPVDTSGAVRFDPRSGGVRCGVCAPAGTGGRLLPPTALAHLSEWLAGGTPALAVSEERAHQRLLREFLAAHLAESRPLKAWAVWEQGGW